MFFLESAVSPVGIHCFIGRDGFETRVSVQCADDNRLTCRGLNHAEYSVVKEAEQKASGRYQTSENRSCGGQANVRLPKLPPLCDAAIDLPKHL